MRYGVLNLRHNAKTRKCAGGVEWGVMGANEASTANEDITIRHCTMLEEFRQCVALQKSVWGWDDEDLIPTRFFVVAHKIEGQVIGAFESSAQPERQPSGQVSDQATGQSGDQPGDQAGDQRGEKIVGFCLAVPGFHGPARYLHSHMLAVLPEYRRQGLGRRLKLEQRREALKRGIRLIEWTFDPLEWKNAAFNLNRLGAIVRRYVPNQYGISSSPLHRGLPTDRLIAEWWLDSPRVVSRVGTPVAAHSSQQPESSPAIEDRIFFPLETKENGISSDYPAAEIQSELRRRLQQAFAEGLAATGLEASETTAGYLLSSWSR